MIETALLLLIAIPLIACLVIFVLPSRWRGPAAFLAAMANFAIAVFLFKKEAGINLPWAGFGMDFSLRLYNFSGFIVLAAAFFGLLIALYSVISLKNKNSAKYFFALLILSLFFVNGAVLANNLVLLLFFWEGVLLVLYGLIAIGGKFAFKTALKALVIVGISDLCLMAGIALTGHLAHTLAISEINLSLLNPLSSIAFMLLVIGAIAKAGCMPFHTWIPDAAEDAPLPFMAFFPAAIEKLLGIYFLARITLDMFKLSAGSVMSSVLMIIGAITIILAVMMALVQKDYKRLLSYHAISQVGYMILGIGTCLPAGIIGGIFHMLNNALYKCGLFLTGGAVEKQTGTTDLEKLGGLRMKMPITFFCFFITAASISGVPPFNGFFSKELIYDAALKRGVIFYLAAIIGSFLTAASFLKLGHAAYFGKIHQEHREIKEAHISMLIPMIILALVCAFFGLFHQLPVNSFIQPILGAEAQNHSESVNWMLILISILVLTLAIVHHYVASKKAGSGLKAADHIHYAPVLSVMYRWQEKKYFDPYEIGVKFVGKISKLLWYMDRGIDWVYESFVPAVSFAIAKIARKAHAGYYIIYVVWSLVAACAVTIFIFK